LNLSKKRTEEKEPINIDIPLSSTSSIPDPEAVSGKNDKKRKKRAGHFLISFLVIIAITLTVFITVLLYQNRDVLSSRNLKRIWNDILGIELTSSHLDLNLSDTASFVSFQGGLVICDASGLRVIDTEGIEETLDTPVFSAPVITATDDRFLVFDQTGKQLVYSDGENILLSVDEDASVQSAFISEKGLSLILGTDGYLSMVQAYNRSGKLLLEYKTPDYFGILSSLSDDGKTLIFVGMTASSTAMDAQVLFLDLEQSAVTYTLDLGETLPLSIKETGRNVFTIISDRAVYAFDASGNRLSESSYENQSLMMYCWGENGCICLLERHQSGGRYLINSYGESGTIEASDIEIRTPNAMYLSSQGIAFAYDNTVEVYTADLAHYELYQFDSYVNRVIVSKEGTVIAQVDGSLELK